MFTEFLFDRPRRIRFDIQAVIDLEAALNAPFGEIVRRIDRLSLTSICAAIWAGCKHEDPTLNIAGIVKRIQTYIDRGGTLKEVVDALNSAIVASTPLETHEPVSEGNAAPEPAVTG